MSETPCALGGVTLCPPACHFPTHLLVTIMVPHHNDKRDGLSTVLMCYDQVASSLCLAVSAIGIIPKPASLGGSHELHSTQRV